MPLNDNIVDNEVDVTDFSGLLSNIPKSVPKDFSGLLSNIPKSVPKDFSGLLSNVPKSIPGLDIQPGYEVPPPEDIQLFQQQDLEEQQSPTPPEQSILSELPGRINRTILGALQPSTYVRALETIPEGIASMIYGKPMRFKDRASEEISKLAISPEQATKAVQFFNPLTPSVEGGIQQGTEKFLGSFAAGFTSPEMAAILGPGAIVKIAPLTLGKVAPKAAYELAENLAPILEKIDIPTQRYFQATMALSEPEQIESLYNRITEKNPSTADQVEAALGVISAAGFPVHIERGLRKRLSKEFNIAPDKPEHIVKLAPQTAAAQEQIKAEPTQAEIPPVQPIEIKPIPIEIGNRVQVKRPNGLILQGKVTKAPSGLFNLVTVELDDKTLWSGPLDLVTRIPDEPIIAVPKPSPLAVTPPALHATPKKEEPGKVPTLEEFAKTSGMEDALDPDNFEHDLLLQAYNLDFPSEKPPAAVVEGGAVKSTQPGAPEPKPAATGAAAQHPKLAGLNWARENIPWGERGTTAPELRHKTATALRDAGFRNKVEAEEMALGEKPFPTREKFEQSVDGNLTLDAVQLLSKVESELRDVGLNPREATLPKREDFKTAEEFWKAAYDIEGKMRATGASAFAGLVRTGQVAGFTKPPAATGAPAQKMPWEQSYREFMGDVNPMSKLGDSRRQIHEQLVKEAIARGDITSHPDYPDLKPTIPTPAATGAKGGGNPFDTSATSAKLTQLDQSKPRPTAKFFGKTGGTPELRAEHDAKIRQWNNARAKAVKEHRAMVEKSNEWIRNNKTSEPTPPPAGGGLESRESLGGEKPVTPEHDKAYLKAVESGDTATAQKMVDEAAKKAGYDVEVFHAGTVRDKFDQSFAGTGVTGTKSGHIYFASNKYAAEYYGEEGTSRIVKPFRLKGRFVEFDGGSPRANADKTYMDAFQRGEEGAPGTVTRNVVDGDARADIYTLPYDFDGTTTDAKLADAITRDPAGRVIPISERFNPKSPDIRYSIEGEQGTPLSETAIQSRLTTEHNLPEGSIRVFNDPNSRAEGRALFQDGQFVGIELNSARLKSVADVDRVLQHELSEAANADGSLGEKVNQTLSQAEINAVLADVERLGYDKDVQFREAEARGIETLVNAWKDRSWFGKIVGHVLAWADSVGVPMTRRAAEAIAAKAVAAVHDTVAKQQQIDSAIWKENQARESLESKNPSDESKKEKTDLVQPSKLPKTVEDVRRNYQIGIIKEKLKASTDAILKSESDVEIQKHLEDATQLKVELAKLEGSKVKVVPEEVSEYRIDRKVKKDDIFKMDDGDLEDYLNKKFPDGESPKVGDFGRSSEYTFPTYDAFKNWMDARYSERDLDGMKLGFSTAKIDFKKLYIKDNGVTSTAGHKQDWIRHLASGSELPKTDPPIARTTPRPTATGTPPRPAPQPGTRPTRPPPPPQPPPPPRTPTPFRKFDITALVQFFRKFKNHPVMSETLKRAYGRYLGNTEIVKLKKNLFWDPAFAERVLGHEIGHFIDLAVEERGVGGSLRQKFISGLNAARNTIFSDRALRNAAENLSREWRGPFSASDRYRRNAKELFADYMSAMFNSPEWVNTKYPLLHDVMTELKNKKPEFNAAYDEIESWLSGDTMADELRKQDKEAVKKTFDILTEDIKKSGPGAKSRLTFEFATLWQRAYEKEKAPKLIGTRLSEKLENSYTWASRQLSFLNDDFMKNVKPHLDLVNADPVQAHADLLSYTKAVRTIGEVRAAGQWLKDNSPGARIMLKAILDIDASARNKFSAALDSATDAQLYDLSAKILREIYDGGEEHVKRIIKEINSLNFGVSGEAAMMAFNVRGKLLNPGGLTEATSRKMLDRLKKELTPDQYSNLEMAANSLRDLMFDISKKMRDAGLISEKTWKELIEPNRDNYVPYAVLDHFDGKVRAGVMKQIGTAKDVADVVVSTQLKAASSLAWLQKQRQVDLLKQIYEAGGTPIPIGELLKRSSDLEGIKNRNKSDDISRAVYWKDGSPHLIEFPGDKGKLFEEALALPDFYEHFSWLHDLSKYNMNIMQIFTTLNPSFLFYRNIVRGFRTAGLKVGYIKAAQQVFGKAGKENLKLAWNYANAAFGGEMLPEVRAMVENEALPPPRLARGMVKDLPNMRELLEQSALPAFEALNKRYDLSENKTNAALQKARDVKNKADKVFTAYEAFEKIYNYKAALEGGFDTETASAVAQRGGIPRPGVSGRMSSIMEIFFPWTRVKIQGMRSTLDMLQDPRFGKDFAIRFALTEALPRLAKVALGIGVATKAVSWMMNKDEDPNDPVISEVFRRVSPYKMALDDTFSFALYDSRTGKYHTFWEFKSGRSIPKHYEVVSWRLPSSEEGQMWGTLLYASLTGYGRPNEQLATPGHGLKENLASWAGNYFLPQKSPVLSTLGQLSSMVFEGRNPIDPFTMHPAANDLLFKAGGKERAESILGYALGKAGGPGTFAAWLMSIFGVLDDRSLNSLSRRLSTDKRSLVDKFPFLKSALSYDNYGEFRKVKLDQLETEKFRAKAKLLMPPELADLYNTYYRYLKRQDSLTVEEKIEFAGAKYFVNKIWEKLSKNGVPDESSFYSRAVHAAGPDGSEEAKKTLIHDLEKIIPLIRIPIERAKEKARAKLKQKTELMDSSTK